jgi:hypothetical protein
MYQLVQKKLVEKKITHPGLIVVRVPSPDLGCRRCRRGRCRAVVVLVLLGGLYCAPTFHMESIWNPSNFAHSIWIPSIPYGIFLGEVQAILRFPFHMDSTWNGEIPSFHVEFPLGIHVERLWNHGITGLALSYYLII